MSHEHLKTHLPFIVEMIESVKTVEFRQKWQIMKELIESNKLTSKQIETIEINIKKAKELKEQYKKTIVYTSLPNAEAIFDKETTKTENVTAETNQKTEKAEIIDLKAKKQMKELKRLHENIVKDEIPLPSKRRSAQKRSYRDSLELLLDKSDDFPNFKKKKSDADLEKKALKEDSSVTEESAKPKSKAGRKSLELPKIQKIATESRKSLGNSGKIKSISKAAENDQKISEAEETLIPTTKSVGKEASKSDSNDDLKKGRGKRKSVEIVKPQGKRKLKEISVVESQSNSTEFTQPEDFLKVIEPEKVLPQNDEKSIKSVKDKPKASNQIKTTISAPEILKKDSKISITMQEATTPIVKSKPSQAITDSINVSKIVIKKVIKPIPESAKPTKQIQAENEPKKAQQKEEQSKPLEIKKSSMDKLRRKIQKHHKKEVLKKKSRATLLTKGASIKKSSKIDDDEWEDMDDSDDLNFEDEIESEEEVEQISDLSGSEMHKSALLENEKSALKDEDQKPAKIENPVVIKKVQNMAYIPCKTGFIFKCLVGNCKFQTMDNPAFVDHIENEHLTVKWLGQCDICNDKVDATRSIIFELMHMRENHVLKEDSNTDDLPDITEYVEPEILKKQELKLEKSKALKSDDELKKDSKTPEIKSAEKVALVGKKIDIGKIKLIPYKGTPLSPPKLSESEVKKSSSTSDSNKLSFSQPEASKSIAPTKVDKNIQPDTQKIINISKNQHEIAINTPDGKQKIIKHIIVKPPQDKESTPLVVKPKQSNASAQKLQSANTKQQTPTADKNAINQRQKSTDSQMDKSSADILRPWLKRKVKKCLMPTTRFLNNVGAIISTYKCMSSKCSFYTSDRDLFNAHLRFHDTHQTGDRDYMNCSYCDHIFNEKDQVIALVEHVDNEHCFDKYQCKYCFYRSCVSLNVINHQQIYHAMKPKSVYELTCDKNRDYEKELEAVKKSRLRCVPPLSCVKCNAKFYLFPKLSTHMQTHGPNIKTKCTKCSKVSDLSNIHTHFINCHKLGLYQCVFCVFGSNNFENIINHIGNCHPSKPPIYCERSNEKSDEVNPASIESTCLKFLTQQVDHRIVETPKVNQEILRNEKNVGDLGGNCKVYPAQKTKTPSPNKEIQPTKKVPEAKLGSALKKVESKMASATELVKEIETIKSKKKTQKTQSINNEKTTGIQIKSVFSLNKF